jgi:hypothetical protein
MCFHLSFTAMHQITHANPNPTSNTPKPLNS